MEPSVDLYKRLARPWQRTSHAVVKVLADPFQFAQRKGMRTDREGGEVMGMLTPCKGEPFKHEVSWGLVSFSKPPHGNLQPFGVITLGFSS